MFSQFSLHPTFGSLVKFVKSGERNFGKPQQWGDLPQRCRADRRNEPSINYPETNSSQPVNTLLVQLKDTFSTPVINHSLLPINELKV